MIKLHRQNYSFSKKLISAISKIWSLFSENAEERAFCFFVFWTNVSREDPQSTLIVQLIHGIEHREIRSRWYKRKESIPRGEGRKV